jgi:hypothetical protein
MLQFQGRGYVLCMYVCTYFIHRAIFPRIRAHCNPPSRLSNDLPHGWAPRSHHGAG